MLRILQEPVRAWFLNFCPNCNGKISDRRLMLKAPCEDCISNNELEEILKSGKDIKFEIAKLLRKKGLLKDYKKIIKLEKLLKEFSKFFEKAMLSKPWSIQRAWAQRVIKKTSFSILAPTGVGKTVFGLVMACYLASKGKRCYLVLPTRALVKQVYEKIRDCIKRTKVDVKVTAYLSKNKEEVNERIQKGDFDILVTTSRFLITRFKDLKDKRFDFIFVDDVDAILKASKSIEYVLELLGFPADIIQDTLSLIKDKIKLLTVKEDSELRNDVENKTKAIEKKLRKVRHGILIVSTATGKAKGLRPKLFRQLLGFEVGLRQSFLRNVCDTYLIPKNSVEKELVKLVKRLGSGGLIFIPLGKGFEYAKDIEKLLNKEGIKAKVISSRQTKLIEEFIKGNIDILIGASSYYGILVRGIDIPERIRYSVFVGIPKFSFEVYEKEFNLTKIKILLFNLREVLDEARKRKTDELLTKLRRIETKIGPKMLKQIADELREGKEVTKELRRAAYLITKASSFVQECLSDKEVLRKMNESEYLAFEKDKKGLKILIPDIATYMQASGRTSRMFAGGITKGLSVVISDDKKVLKNLIRQSKWYYEDIEWRNFNEINLNELIKQIDKDREKVRRLKIGKDFEAGFEPLKNVLLIVESPTKARTISSFFGKPSRRRIGSLSCYEISIGNYLLNVIASKGHIIDLTTLKGFHGIEVQDSSFIPVYTTIRRCKKCNEQFVDFDKCPRCGSNFYLDSIKTINSLREVVSEFDSLLIATDPDTEGEKIGWDITCITSPYLNSHSRIEFHEITRRAITNSLKNQRELDKAWVLAQMVRRIEDRWIGFELSKRLWQRFVKGLSAGRVQTPVLGWVIQRYEESKKSIADQFFIRLENEVRLKFVTKHLAPNKVIQDLQNIGVKVEAVNEEEVKLNPKPPYITSTLLTDATTKFKMSANEVMSIAQKLFELGLITYHRTDSTTISDKGIQIAKEYLKEKLSLEYLKSRSWKMKGAHEAIRPTKPIDADSLRHLVSSGVVSLTRSLDRKDYLIYDLIFKRFIASQMTEAKVVRQIVVFNLHYGKVEYEQIVDVKDEGFLAITKEFTIKPRFKKGELVKVSNIKHIRAPTILPYTSGEVIALMKERGLGRPSTYAKIVETLIERRYVIQTKKGRLIPTQRGIAVYSFLSKGYSKLISEQRTKTLEEKMDEVQNNFNVYHTLLSELYKEITSIS
jgi:reverse gyrase